MAKRIKIETASEYEIELHVDDGDPIVIPVILTAATLEVALSAAKSMGDGKMAAVTDFLAVVCPNLPANLNAVAQLKIARAVMGIFESLRDEVATIPFDSTRPAQAAGNDTGSRDSSAEAPPKSGILISGNT